MITNSHFFAIITVCLLCALFATLINLSLHSHISVNIEIDHAGTERANNKGMTTTATKEASLVELEMIGNDYVTIEDDLIIPNNDTRKNPQLIIHVGPPKTATTTIQCGLQRYGQELIHDNYYYIGKRCKGKKKKKGYQSTVNVLEIHPIPHDIAIWHKRRKKNSTQIPIYLRSLLEELSYHYKQNHSVIISSESFDDLLRSSPSHVPLVHLFHSLVSQWDWHFIQIIVNYRRYSDWITSVYPRNLNHHTDQTNSGGWKDWEDQGGYVPPSVVDYIRGTFPPSINGNGGGYDEWMQVLPSIRSHRAWSTLFSTVSVFNIHKPGNIVANFICDTILHATTACSAARGGEAITENKNIRFFEYRFDMHRIVNTAREKGLLGDENLGRDEVFIKTRNQFGSLDGMEMLCLNGIERQRVYEMTMAIEQYMLPEWYKEEKRRGSHDVLKEKIDNSTKYCGVDIEAVLRNQTWMDFFQNLTSVSI